MKNKNNGVALFLGLLAMYTALFGARYGWQRWTRAITLETDKPSYLHHEFVAVRLKTRDPALKSRWSSSAPKVAVTREGKQVATIAGLRELRLRHDPSSGDWVGRWPCPWNAPAGQYALELLEQAPAVSERLRLKPFMIAYRRPQALPKGFAVLTLESAMPLRTMKVRAPDGSTKDWRGLLDWVEYIGADAFWLLGGQTPGEKPGQVWLDYNFSLFPDVARECHRRGIKFGLYAMCYLTMSKERLARYEYAREVQDGRSVETRAISLREARRVEDVAALLEKFRDIPGVDYVGLDYIRNALGGYELADEFYAQMPGVTAPPDWARLSFEEKMVYFARKKIMRKDLGFIDAWQWWRAHKVGGIVSAIKKRLGDSKPLWAFTLTWDKGWHHGQDPVMMNDAGVDADALMLYEATEEQFDGLLRDWNGYVKSSDVQLVVGDVVDWPLHQKAPEGPAAFSRRLKHAVDRVYSDGPARGLFIHDIGRALWGRLGAWSTRQWMDEAKAAVIHLKSQASEAPGRSR